MPTTDDQNILAETTLDRALRISDYIEKLISTIGEHPECELKREWRKNDLRDKAEFIKDIQATANSLDMLRSIRSGKLQVEIPKPGTHAQHLIVEIGIVTA